jgi:hypothetical protein
VATFTLYALTAAPTVFWLDSSELAAASFELGIPHPPGHPLFVFLGKLATFIPLGTIAFRVHLMCAAMMAVSVGLAGHAILALWGPTPHNPTTPQPHNPTTLLVVLPILAVSTPFWLHSVRAEVYPLHLLLATSILWLTVNLSRSGRLVDLVGLAFVTGLALSNHHYLTVFLAPGVLLLLLTSRASRGITLRRVHVAIAFMMYGLLPYILLPVRSAAFPTVRWGSGETFGGFLWIVTARAFQKTAQRVELVSIPDVPVNLWLFFDDNLGVITLLLAIVGLVMLARSRPRLAIAAVVLTGSNLLTQVLFDFDRQNPDVAGYFLVSVWVAVVLAAGGVAALLTLARRLSTFNRRLLQVSAVAVPLCAAALLLPAAAARADLSEFRQTDQFADATYGVAPPDALLITSYFETIFNLWYRDVAEARRPDVAVVHRLFLTYPGYADYVRDRYPALEGILDGDRENHDVSTDWLIARSESKPVLIEANFNLDPRLARHLLPRGLVTHLMPLPIPSAPFPQYVVNARESFWTGFYSTADIGQRETAANLLWLHVNRASLLLGQGQADAAHWHADRAFEISPGDPDIEMLMRD